MTDYGSLAVYDINAFLWQQLQASGLINVNDYTPDGALGPLVPIIPSQQVPDFNNMLPGKPYIIYDWEVLPTQSQWWISHEIASYMVVSTNYDFIASILNFMQDLFRRYDDSATTVKQSNILSGNFLFHYTTIQSIKSPEPMKNEGGLRVGSVDIMYSYARILTNNRF